MFTETLHVTLKKYWGFDAFRPPQEDIVRNILIGRDALITLPTGGGKSLCFQLPAVISPGLTIVISPLIALMQDQVDGLNRKGIQACFLNSSLLPQDYKERLLRISDNEYRLLYLAPEQFRSTRLLEILKKISLSRVVLDEAHCLSEWGSDFRPDYRTFVKHLKLISPEIQLVALTATATIKTREEIKNVLSLKNPYISISSFDRTNLFFGIKKFFTPLGKYLELKKLLKASDKALIYCSTRNNTKELFKTFSARHSETAYYNAGLSQTERKTIQEKYQNGEIKYLFATTAFGMGIDISDIDTVIYWNCPSSPEEYYQGIGRAGRNPEIQAESWLLYYRPDYLLQKKRLSESTIQRSDIKKVMELLKENKQVARNTTELSESTFNAVKLILEEENINFSNPEKKDFKLIQQKYEAIIKNKADKLASIKSFIDKKTCKRKIILNYFGEETNQFNCGNCSYCLKK